MFDWIVDHPRLFFGTLGGLLAYWIAGNVASNSRKEDLIRELERESLLSPREVAALSQGNRVPLNAYAAVVATVLDAVAADVAAGRPGAPPPSMSIQDGVALVQRAVGVQRRLAAALADTAAAGAGAADGKEGRPLAEWHLLQRAAALLTAKQAGDWTGTLVDVNTTAVATAAATAAATPSSTPVDVTEEPTYAVRGTLADHFLSPAEHVEPMHRSRLVLPRVPLPGDASLRDGMTAGLDPLLVLSLLGTTLGAAAEVKPAPPPEVAFRWARPFWAVLVPRFAEQYFFGAELAAEAAAIATAKEAAAAEAAAAAAALAARSHDEAEREVLRTAATRTLATPAMRVAFYIAMARRYRAALGGTAAPPPPPPTLPPTIVIPTVPAAPPAPPVEAASSAVADTLAARMVASGRAMESSSRSDCDPSQTPPPPAPPSLLATGVPALDGDGTVDAQLLLDTLALLAVTNQISPRFRTWEATRYPWPAHRVASPERHLWEAAVELSLEKKWKEEAKAAGGAAKLPPPPPPAVPAALSAWRSRVRGLPGASPEETAWVASIPRSFTAEEASSILFSRSVCAWGECTAHDLQPSTWLKPAPAPTPAPAIATAPAAAPAPTLVPAPAPATATA